MEDLTMSTNETVEDHTYPLAILERLLETPQLLPHESRKEFFQIFKSLLAYGKPQAIVDYIAVYQATVLTWDILRYQEMKVGVIRVHQKSALVSLLSKAHEGAGIKGAEAAVLIESNQRAKRWFADPATRPASLKMIENAGYPPNAVEVEAFQNALSTLATIDRLIVSAQKRLDKFLKELEKTSRGTAEALRSATAKATAKTPDPTQDVPLQS
jgi:hypothetical protein